MLLVETAFIPEYATSPHLEMVVLDMSYPRIGLTWESQSNVRIVRSVDPELYRKRNMIERFFNRLKHFRGIATRYFKTAANFLAAIHLAAARLWIRSYESTT